MEITFLNNAEQEICTMDVSLMEDLESLHKQVSNAFFNDFNDLNGISMVESELIETVVEAAGLHENNDLLAHESEPFFGFYRAPQEKTYWKDKLYNSASLFIINQAGSKHYKLLTDGRKHIVLNSEESDQANNIFLTS